MKLQLNLVFASLAALSLLFMPALSRADGLLQAGDTAHPITLFAASASDGQTGVTGLTLAVTISKNCSAFASPTGTVTEIGGGFYKFTPSAADDGTDGELIVNATATGAYINPERRRIIAVNPDDPALFGLTNVGTLTGQTNLLSGQAALQTGQATMTAKTNLIATNAADSPNAVTAQGQATSGAVILAAINAQTSSAARQADMIIALTDQGYTVTRSAGLDKLDAAVSSRQPSGPVIASSVTAPVTVAVNNDKAGYTVSTVQDKAGYTAVASNFVPAPTSAQIAAMILATPANLLATDTSGRTSANNFPATVVLAAAQSFNNSGQTTTPIWVATTPVKLPAAPPAGYSTLTAQNIIDAFGNNTVVTGGAPIGSIVGNWTLTATNGDDSGKNLSQLLDGMFLSEYGPLTGVSAALLKTPANLLATDASGLVGASNLPADYQQRGVAVTLPAAPAGYGGGAGGVTLAQIQALLPANFGVFKIDPATGGVTVVSLPATPPAGYGGSAPIVHR